MMTFLLTAKPLRLLSISLLAFSAYTHAAIELGDASSPQGQLGIGGAIRAKYQYKDFTGDSNDSKLEFADAKLVMDYTSPHWLARIDYRCYQNQQLCDLSTLVDAWVGYKIDEQQQMIAGVNTIPFGMAQYWGNTYYEGLMYTVGLEDTHNLGIKYQYQSPQNELQLGFYPSDAGNYTGDSVDSSRFHANMVKADDLSSGTNTQEKNMLIGRVAHTFGPANRKDGLKTQLGASYLYSSVENKRTRLDGTRQAWTLFADSFWQRWNLKLAGGQQYLRNKDNLFGNYTTFGAFDFPYNIANRGDFYSAEINYNWPASYGKLTDIKPYLNYATYHKKATGFQDSTRIISGLMFNYDSWGIQAEYILSKNDPMVGGTLDSLAQGDGKGWNRLLYISLGYYF